MKRQAVNKPHLSPVAGAVKASIVAIGIAHGTSQAAQLIVTSNADDFGNPAGCTLREAVTAVNQGSAYNGCFNTTPQNDFGVVDTIVVSSSSLGSNTITLRGDSIEIERGVFVQGFTGLTIDGDQQSERLISINSSSSTITANLNDLTLINAGAGSIYVSRSRLILRDSTISSSTTSSSGSAIRGYQSDISVFDSVLQNNRSNSSGGAIAINLSSLIVEDSIVSNNYSGFFGGAIYIDYFSPVEITNTQISGNSANRNGGAIGLNRYSSLVLNNSSIDNNQANMSGGGIDLRYESSATFKDSTLSNNEASGGSGGAVNFQNNFATPIESVLNSANSTFSGNRASNAGGAIFTSDVDNIIISNSTITANSAMQSGGIYVDNGFLKLTNSIVANSQGGADCEIPAGLLSTTRTIIEDGSCNSSLAVDPLLGPLADNGGGTLTHSLQPNSPARGYGSDCLPFDQRGAPRDANCDIGAIEAKDKDVFFDDNFIVIPLTNGKAVVIPN